MTVLNKWNVPKRIYEDYEVPDDWNVTIFESDMNKAVNCASCGKELTFGETYTSREIHTGAGFGYAVCEHCYELEFRREERWK